MAISRKTRKDKVACRSTAWSLVPEDVSLLHKMWHRVTLLAGRQKIILQRKAVVIYNHSPFEARQCRLWRATNDTSKRKERPEDQHPSSITHYLPTAKRVKIKTEGYFLWGRGEVGLWTWALLLFQVCGWAGKGGQRHARACTGHLLLTGREVSLGIHLDGRGVIEGECVDVQERSGGTEDWNTPSALPASTGLWCYRNYCAKTY